MKKFQKMSQDEQDMDIAKLKKDIDNQEIKKIYRCQKTLVEMVESRKFKTLGSFQNISMDQISLQYQIYKEKKNGTDKANALSVFNLMFFNENLSKKQEDNCYVQVEWISDDDISNPNKIRRIVKNFGLIFKNKREKN